MKEGYLKEQLEAKENMLAQTTRFLIQIQKDLEQKNDELLHANKEIIDSINFATLIQKSLLPDIEILKVFFKDATFKINQQIGIGGDTIFVKNTKSGIVFGLFDSTGHGVPASLLSISGTLLLKELMSSMEITNPQNLLYLLNNQLHKTFNNTKFSIAHKEGIIFNYSSTKKTLAYSSAKGKAIIISKSGEIKDLPYSKKAIGDEVNTAFDLFKIRVKPEDKLLIYSDGMIDQFGGERNKKFTKLKLKKILSEIHQEKVSTISDKIMTEFNQWKGTNLQTDDASFMLIEF